MKHCSCWTCNILRVVGSSERERERVLIILARCEGMNFACLSCNVSEKVCKREGERENRYCK